MLARYKKITKRNHPLQQSIVKGNGYKTWQTSKGLTKEQTLMLSRTSTLHNLLFYAHSSCLIAQTQTFLLAHCSIYAGMCLFCSGSQLKTVNKKIKQWFHNHSTLLPALYNDKKHESTSLGCNLHPTLGPLLKFIYLPFFLIYQQFAHSSKYGKVSSRNQWACS